MTLNFRSLAVFTISLAAVAHFAWIDAAPGKLVVGQPAKVRIGFGHDLAKSESAISLDGTSMFAISPSGAKTELKPAVDGVWLSAAAAVKDKGVHRFYFTQDRGIMSQTTKGYKPGGRDVHPDAKKSYKSWRSGLVYAWTADAKFAAGKAIGLPLEVLADRSSDSVTLTVLRDGKPASGAEVSVAWPGVEEAQSVGKADGNGRFVYKVPAGKTGQFVLLAAVVEPAQKGLTYDTNNFTSSVLLNW